MYFSFSFASRTAALRWLGTFVCAVLIGGSVFLAAPASAHANTQAELQQTIYKLLLDVLSIQERILTTRNYELIPQTHQLLDQVMALKAQVDGRPGGYSTPSDSDDGGGGTSADRNCSEGGGLTTTGTTDTLLMPNGVTLNAIATVFRCQNGEWVTGTMGIPLYEGNVRELERETSPLIFVGQQSNNNDDSDNDSYYRRNGAYSGTLSGSNEDEAIEYAEEDVVEGIEYRSGDEVWYTAVLRDRSTRSAPYTDRSEMVQIVRDSGFVGDIDQLLQSGSFGTF